MLTAVSREHNAMPEAPAAARLARRLAQDRDRQARHVARRRDAGLVRILVWIPAAARDQLDHYAATHRLNRSEAIARLIAAAPRPAPEPPAAADLPPNRASLARLGHAEMNQGRSLVDIARLWNERGWTPDRIGRDPETPPRADAPATWTNKTVYRLLKQAYPA